MPHQYGTQKSIDKLEAVQRRAARFVLNRYYNTSSVNLMLDPLTRMAVFGTAQRRPHAMG